MSNDNRDRADSYKDEKKYEKMMGGFNEQSKPFNSP
jgi:hypothetical protein